VVLQECNAILDVTAVALERRTSMAIDFTLAPEHEEIRLRVREFVQDAIIPA